jgi:hypothetical protein
VNPQALGRSAVSFYCFLIHSRVECLRVPDFLRYLCATYARSAHFHQRIVYVKLAAALLVEFLPDEYLDVVWPVMLGYADERVPLVRTHVLEFLVSFGRAFQTVRSPVLSGQIDALLSNYADDTDPQVAALLPGARAVVGPRRLAATGPLPLDDPRGLPVIPRAGGSPRVLKGPRGSAVIPRPSRPDPRGLPTPRRPAVAGRLPSPGIPQRTPAPPDVPKSLSSPVVHRLSGTGRPR